MSILEIVLLIAGLILFAVSFLLPEKKAQIDKKDLAMAEELVQGMVEKETQQLRSHMEEVVDETVTYSIEKAERTLERISNEKIMAVNEYSDTVLENIHKNHEEVVFLYDMLNQKQQALKNTVLEAQKTVKAVELKSKAIKEEFQSSLIEYKTGLHSKKEMQPKVSANKQDTVTQAELGEQNQSLKLEKEESNTKKKQAKKEVTKIEVPKKEVNKIEVNKIEASTIELQFSQATPNTQNSNEKILGMHKAGKSKIQIAKELGLGVGEVKLVIDLFEGI